MKGERSVYLNPQVVKIAKEVAEKLNKPLEIVLLAYRSYFENMRNIISEIDFLEIEDEVPRPFNIGSIGKLHVRLDRAKAINKQKIRKRENSKYKEGDANV